MKVLYLIIFILFFSCAQRIKVPINRMISPEAMGGGFEMQGREVGFSSGVISFDDNSTSNPLGMAASKDKELYLGIGVAQKADLFIRVPEESSSLLGLKVQLLGTPIKEASVGHSLALTMGMGSERDTFDQVFTIDLKSDVTDYSLIHGYRFSPKVLFYDGVSISNYSFVGTVNGATGLTSNDIKYTAKNILGAHGGLILGGSSFKLTIEFAVQKIEWTNTDSKMYQHVGMALSAGW